MAEPTSSASGGQPGLRNNARNNGQLTAPPPSRCRLVGLRQSDGSLPTVSVELAGTESLSYEDLVGALACRTAVRGCRAAKPSLPPPTRVQEDLQEEVLSRNDPSCGLFRWSSGGFSSVTEISYLTRAMSLESPED